MATKRNALAIALAIVGFVAVQAQPSHTMACDRNCIGKKHKYTFCTQSLAGRAVDKDICVENPHTTTDPVTGQAIKHYHPSLNRLGLIDCTKLDQATSDLSLGSNSYQPLRYFTDGTSYVVFLPTPDVVRSNLESAMREWTKCCDKGGVKLEYTSSTWPKAPSNCCLVVYWSADASLFDQGPGEEPAIASTRIVGSSATSCDGVNCDDAYEKRGRIALNQSPIFKGPKIQTIPTRFFINQELFDRVKVRMINDGYVYYDFITVLVHELGHVFGIAHDNGPDDNGDVCDDDPSVMYSEAKSWTNNRQVSTSDCCKFQKIYCCAETTTSVIEDLGQSENPNAVLCGGCEDGSTLVDLRLYNLNGRLLNVYHVPGGMTLARIGEYIHTDPGVYVCVAQLPTGERSFKILVSR